MDIQKLLIYTKEELATYILQNNFLSNIESDLKYIHVQKLIEEDEKINKREYKKMTLLLEKIKNMPCSTIDDQFNRAIMFEKYKKNQEKNILAYKKRQAEINKLLETK